MKDILVIENLCVCWSKKEVLHNISLTLHEREILGIIGESGSGKTTLARSIMGILNQNGTISSGKILLKTEDRIQNLVHLNERTFRTIRGEKISMVFQDASSGFCPVRTIGSQIIDNVKAHRRLAGRIIKKNAANLLETFGFENAEKIWRSYPFELSGGMCQRIAIIMAIMNHPQILIADEPTSALDGMNRQKVIDALKTVNQMYGTSVVLISHDIKAAETLCSSLYVLEKGEIVDRGKTEDLMNSPVKSYTRNLIQSCSQLKTYE